MPEVAVAAGGVGGLISLLVEVNSLWKPTLIVIDASHEIEGFYLFIGRTVAAVVVGHCSHDGVVGQ